MTEKKNHGGKIEFILETNELIEFCHNEVVALAAKMGEFNKLKKKIT